MTKRDFYNAIATKAVITDEMVEMANKYIAQLDSRNENRKPSKTQVENEAFKADILGVLGAEGMTVTEVMKALDNGLSNQKVSALLKQLVDTQQVTKTIEKRKSYFSLA